MGAVTEQGLAQRLAAETTRLLGIVEKLGTRLAETMATDVNENNTPSRDWCRAYGQYRGTVKDLLGEQREGILLRAKLKLDAQEPLTDEQYNAELLDLGREALGSLTREEIEHELAARKLTPAIAVQTEDDE